MMGFMYSRRHFGKLALAGLPLALTAGKINSTVNGVRIGVQTYSFRNVLRQPGEVRQLPWVGGEVVQFLIPAALRRQRIARIADQLPASGE